MTHPSRREQIARTELDEALKVAVEAYSTMDPVDRALHDSDQRRSFVRGQSGLEPPRDVLADEVRRLRAILALPQPPERERWRDIASAPRDYEEVLVVDARGNVAIANYEPRAAQPFWNTDLADLTKDGTRIEAIYWMPLPLPPTDEAGA